MNAQPHETAYVVHRPQASPVRLPNTSGFILIEDGALRFETEDALPDVIFAAGCWDYVQFEEGDDEGEI